MKRQITYHSLLYNNQIKQIIKLLTFLMHVYMIVHDILFYVLPETLSVIYARNQHPDSIRDENRINFASHK